MFDAIAAEKKIAEEEARAKAMHEQKEAAWDMAQNDGAMLDMFVV